MMDSHCGYEVVNHPVTLCGILFFAPEVQGRGGQRVGKEDAGGRRTSRDPSAGKIWLCHGVHHGDVGQKWIKKWAGVLLCLYPQMNRDTNQPKQGIYVFLSIHSI